MDKSRRIYKDMQQTVYFTFRLFKKYGLLKLYKIDGKRRKEGS